MPARLGDSWRRSLTDRTKLVAVTHASNAVGTMVDVGRVVEAAHSVGARCTSMPCTTRPTG